MKTKTQFSTLKLYSLTMALSAVAAMPALASANEGGPSLGVVVGATIQNPSFNHSGSGAATSVSGNTAFGGGLTTEFGLREGVGLEADLLYLNHKFSRTVVGSGSATVTSGYFQIPVLIRYRPIPYVNLGAGAYYSRTVSTWSASGGGASNTSADYGKNDFGFELALGTNIPLTNALSLIADLRYARSLTDSAQDSGDALKFSDFQILAGVRFGF